MTIAANVKNLNGEEIDDAVQIITNEYESRKRRKRKLRSPEDPSRLEKLNKDSYENTEREPLAERARRLTTTSTKSSDSTVTVKRGYDKDTFVYFLKRHNLKDCEENLRKSKIDCLQTFLELNEEKLEQLGLEYGQVRKCLKAIGEAIGEATTKPKKETLAT
ncbi:uncharacterized protein LOC134262404 [Saccostrea cucullata]|uniref:uncharacterized protein LOC134262404 n=1 Tax=Saccostrea cuccullata TaxID=36930 RepID=UPI002ED44477